jgi:hypothetical protein
MCSSSFVMPAGLFTSERGTSKSPSSRILEFDLPIYKKKLLDI